MSESMRRDLLPSRRACLPLLAGAMTLVLSARALGATRFEQWVETFRARARARGISDDTYTRVMGGLKPDTSVYALERSQPDLDEEEAALAVDEKLERADVLVAG